MPAQANSPSFVPGTPSSPISTPSKRNRQRSSSPSAPIGLAPRNDVEAKAKFTVRQYLAVESALPITGDVGRGILGESAEREAEYLVDEGSQLARDQLRRDGDPTGDGVQWRTVRVRERTIQDMWIHGRSWTYQLPPPKISLNDPLLIPEEGEIIGKSNAELQEWQKSTVEDAFSPVQSAIPLPAPRGTNTQAARSKVLSSPFDSQRSRKRKHRHPTPSQATPPPPAGARETPETPYVFVNDLPPWEWFLPTASEAGGSQSQGARESLRSADGATVRRDDGQTVMPTMTMGTSKTQSQDMRESLRPPGDQPTLRKQDGQSVNPTTSTPKAGTALPPAPMSPEVGFTSFLTDASVGIASPAPTALETIEAGRTMRRMPVLLKDLDHAKFPHQPEKNPPDKKRTKAPTALEKEVKRREERAAARDKRVRELQAPQNGKRVRPIKDFAPVPMRVEPKADERTVQGLPVFNMASKPVEKGAADESRIEDISFADSVHAGGDAVSERGVPKILVDGVAVVSPEKVTAKRGRKVPQEILSDQVRESPDQEPWRVICEIIPQPHDLPAFPTDAKPEVPDIMYDPIPDLPTTHHPFHSDLRHYIDVEPDTQVGWLIPINGSVTLPLYNQLPAEFRPSAGHLALSSEEYRDLRKPHQRAQSFGTSRARSQAPRQLVWTRELLREFWEKLLKMRQRGRFGPISLAVISGESSRSVKRIDQSVETHQCVQSRSPKQSIDTALVRPEMAEHIAVGCNLRYAMAVRCLLRGIELGGETTTSSRGAVPKGKDTALRETRASSKLDRLRRGQETLSVASKSVKARKEEPFRGVRLCLGGPQGEVLLVV